MLLRSPTLVATCLIFLFSCACPTLAARHHPSYLHNESHATAPRRGNETSQGLICRPFGECEPCPGDQLEQPYCQPFGNRRRTHCVNDLSSSHTTPGSTQTLDSGASTEQKQRPSSSQEDPLNHPGTDHPEGEVLAWEACGRLVKQERADFYEFIACNVFFALIAIFGVFARSRRMQALQSRQLAARIGLTRGVGRR